MPIRFLINQCQIITFLILKYDIIENSRIELGGIVLPVQMGGLLGGGGGGGGGPMGMITLCYIRSLELRLCECQAMPLEAVFQED